MSRFPVLDGFAKVLCCRKAEIFLRRCKPKWQTEKAANKALSAVTANAAADERTGVIDVYIATWAIIDAAQAPKCHAKVVL